MAIGNVVSRLKFMFLECMLSFEDMLRQASNLCYLSIAFTQSLQVLQNMRKLSLGYIIDLEGRAGQAS